MKTCFFLGLCILSSTAFYMVKHISRLHLALDTNPRNYSPFGKNYYEEYIRKLNSKNITIQDNSILDLDKKEEEKKEENSDYDDEDDDEDGDDDDDDDDNIETSSMFPGIKIIFQQQKLPQNMRKIEADSADDGHYYDMNGHLIRTKRSERKQLRSENFEIVTKSPVSFKDIGGYENIKKELYQCVDLLLNYTKYAGFNVRVPKGIILEGPPGNGKTLLAKGFAGETQTAFIPVSGSQFQEKYVGVGASRVREMFDLAKKNIPCIIFIDEIDAIGRQRSSDAEASGGERDNTLNELLVNLDGFSTASGIFLMGATNRADLLDSALTRPGRIDKRIFIGPPDSITREAILSIHIKGKPHDNSIKIKDLVDTTAGLSGAQIENVLNEAMLNALRDNRMIMEYRDIDTVLNKIMVGWQPSEHQFTSDIIDRIAIHEMGHAIVGFLSKHHSKVKKVAINLSSPQSPGYTLFETSTSTIYTREALFEHLMILVAGRIAEEVFYDVSVTTGAINDFEEAFKLAERMILYYGMGTHTIYPSSSDKYKQMIDDEVITLINTAYSMSKFILTRSKNLIQECADLLKKNKLIQMDELTAIITKKYPEILDLKVDM